MGAVRFEPGAKRVRAVLGGQVVADTTGPVLVWEVPYYPTYYLPLADVRTELVPEAALRYGQGPELAGLVRLDWDAMDAWFEEDEEVFTHPRDPYKRVDILASSRRVRVAVDGLTLAESTRPWLLFETGLPPRFYLPRMDVSLDVLEPSERVTDCPYKGRARYWSVRAPGRVHRDLAWSYPAPLPESQKIAGLVAFYDERVDTYVDGVLRDRPRTPFSSPSS
jgi:uncharacterized protein (DUF427 family)